MSTSSTIPQQATTTQQQQQSKSDSPAIASPDQSAQYRLPYPQPQLSSLPLQKTPFTTSNGKGPYDPYVYSKSLTTNPAAASLHVDTSAYLRESAMLPPPSNYLTYAPPRSHGGGMYPFPDYRDALASPSSDFSDDGSTSSDDRWSNFNSPMTSPVSRASTDSHSYKDPAAILLQPAPQQNNANNANGEEKTLLDDFDPTPRAHIHYPPQLPHPSEAPQYALHSSQPPSRTNSYSSLDQLGYYLPDRSYVGPSPSASFISLPETEYDHSLRQNFQGINFHDGRISQNAQGWRSATDLSASQNSEGRPVSRSQSTSRRGRRATIAALDEPLHWASQTTTATKLAAIARRKPGVEAKFRCPYCSETFTRNYNLNGHIRAHRGERPFKCTTCPKAFARAHDLRRHQELHLNPSKYSCKTCGKGFRRIEGLQKHYRQESEAALVDGAEGHCIEPPHSELDMSPPHHQHQERSPYQFQNYNFKFENPGGQAHLFESTSSASSNSSASSQH